MITIDIYLKNKTRIRKVLMEDDGLETEEDHVLDTVFVPGGVSRVCRMNRGKKTTTLINNNEVTRVEIIEGEDK